MGLSDVAGVAALAVALIALLIAAAQVAQQYLGTATLIRKCDSIVYGPLPGSGRRIFVFRQLRFKVVYSIPQISLRSSLWPNRSNYTPLYSDPNQALPPVVRKHDSVPSVGEAAWVSFYRAVEPACRSDLEYQLLEGDVDHCPAELPVVPMQVSMRDVVVLGLMSGLRITDASFSRKLLQMQGQAGTISSAAHPILGIILHFTPQYTSGNHGLSLTGHIGHSWMRRLWSDCPVAGRNISPIERRQISIMEGRWSKRILDYPNYHKYPSHAKSGGQPGSQSQRHYDDWAMVPLGYSHNSGGRSKDLEDKPQRTRPGIQEHDSRSLRQIESTFRDPSQLSMVLWRKPWPKVQGDEVEDIPLVARNHKNQHVPNTSDADDRSEYSFIPPAAPDAPSRGKGSPALIYGAHDGTWSFSSRPCPYIMLTPSNPNTNTSTSTRFSKLSILRLLYERLFSTRTEIEPEEESFLSPMKAIPRPGWTVVEAFHLDPCDVPLPTPSYLSSTSEEELSEQKKNINTNHEEDIPEPMLPPDFLIYGSRIGRKEGPHSVSIERWFQAVSRQKGRQEARGREEEDLHTIRFSRPTEPKFPQTTSPEHTYHEQSIGQSKSFADRRLYIDYKPNRAGPESDNTVDQPKPSHDNNDVSNSERQRRDRSNLNAFVESADEDSDVDSQDSWISEYSGTDGQSESAFSQGQTMIVRHENNHTTHSIPEATEERPSKKSESSSERKIREAQEAASAYRGKAEGEIRKKQIRMINAYMEEKLRQTRISENQKAAERRQRRRDEKRRQRIEKRLKTAEQGPVNGMRVWTDISWYWISQMDIIPGYFATPWAGQFHPHVATGMIAISLEALLGFTDKTSLQYSWTHKRDTWSWLQDGKSTFPPYARNGRGGVVVTGTYQPVAFESFEQQLPPLQLLHCYDYQVDQYPRVDDISALNRQLELMAIDSWLSIAGRTREITDGPANLLRMAPALVEKLMHELPWDFQSLDFYANEGGLQIIQDISAELIDSLEDESLTEAEQLFMLVTLLRTAKVVLCVTLGPSTELAQGLLAVDMPVHLV